MDTSRILFLYTDNIENPYLCEIRKLLHPQFNRNGILTCTYNNGLPQYISFHRPWRILITYRYIFLTFITFSYIYGSIELKILFSEIDQKCVLN